MHLCHPISLSSPPFVCSASRPDRADCFHHGDCTSSGTCHCDPGFEGSTCETEKKCGQRCTAMHREDCVSEKACGGCKARYHSMDDDTGTAVNTPCRLAAPTHSAVAVKYGNATDIEKLTDDLPGTIWSTQFDMIPTGTGQASAAAGGAVSVVGRTAVEFT